MDGKNTVTIAEKSLPLNGAGTTTQSMQAGAPEPRNKHLSSYAFSRHDCVATLPQIPQQERGSRICLCLANRISSQSLPKTHIGSTQTGTIFEAQEKEVQGGEVTTYAHASGNVRYLETLALVLSEGLHLHL